MTGTAHPGPPQPPSGRLVLGPLPERPEAEGAAGVLLNAVPMLGSLGSIVLVSSLGGEARARALVAAGLMLLASVGFVLVQVDRQRRQRTRRTAGARSAYLRHLAGVRRSARGAAHRQRAALAHRHPEPGTLPALAALTASSAKPGPPAWPQRWEAGGEGTLAVRYGVCPQPLACELVPPDGLAVDGEAAPGPAPGSVDPVAAAAATRLLAVHGLLPGLPATVDLGRFDRIELCGTAEHVRALARAVVCSAASGHAPDRLAVAVLCSRAALPHWDWVKWLPHARSEHVHDAVGPARMVTSDGDALERMLPRPAAGGPGRRHLLLVLDGCGPAPGWLRGRPGVTALDLAGRGGAACSRAPLRLEIAGPAATDTHAARPPVRVLVPGAAEAGALADHCGLATAEAFARRLAPLPAAPDGRPGGRGGRPCDVAELLGLGDLGSLDPARQWRPGAGREHLRVPFGVDDDGAPVHLDLKESAAQGMGPHGLVVGATGSGKSELLRTLVLGLTLTHGPDRLALVLVDFKGGATFAGLGDLPHVSAMITNLEEELALVDRMQDALAGEMVRRQELLRRSGHASVRDHERARARGEDLEPLPSLLIVVDEFSELLAARPEFLDLFVALGRLGRSLGIHLLLASQRLDEGRLRGLDAHLSYRIGLRTFSPGESRAVLGLPDAADLPSTPGVGLLRPDPTSLVRFRAAYVSAAPRRRTAPAAAGPRPAILPFSVAPVSPPGPDPAPRCGRDQRAPSPSLLELGVRRMSGAAPRSRRIWLPPLDRPETLGTLMPDLAEDPGLGLVSARWRARGPLVAPVGALDRPREQVRDTLTVDLRGATGHLAVVGGPRSGKSTLLLTTVAGLALTASPLEVRVLVLDLGGGALGALADLPHLAGMASPAEPEVARRIVAEAAALLDRRERGARGEGDDGWGEVLVVVDGWSTVRDELDDLEAPLQRIATRGLAHGVHLLVSAHRWADLRAPVRDACGTRLELRLGDPLDSEADRRVAAAVPAARPGRGLTPAPLHFLGALPRVDASADPGSLAAGAADLAARCAAAWHGPAGPRVRMLPARVDLAEVRAGVPEGAAGGRLLLGVDERDLAPVGVDPTRERHLLVLGEAGSGKTALLRSYAREVVRTRTPAEAQLVVVDYRRSLAGEVPEEHLLDHLPSAPAAAPALRDLAGHLATRLPGSGTAASQRREGRRWSGPEVFVLVDDLDLVAAGPDSPLLALEPLLAQARDVGLHVVAARRSGGASRSLHEPVTRALRDLAAPGLLLSGSADEGPLLGDLRPQPAPPGRARLLTRDRGVQVVQLAWCGTADETAGQGPPGFARAARADAPARDESPGVERKSPRNQTSTGGARDPCTMAAGADEPRRRTPEPGGGTT